MVEYVPKTGKNAGKRNFEAIKRHLEMDPEATGVEIAKALGLSRTTVCNHLKNLKREDR